MTIILNLKGHTSHHNFILNLEEGIGLGAMTFEHHPVKSTVVGREEQVRFSVVSLILKTRRFRWFGQVYLMGQKRRPNLYWIEHRRVHVRSDERPQRDDACSLELN